MKIINSLIFLAIASCTKLVYANPTSCLSQIESADSYIPTGNVTRAYTEAEFDKLLEKCTEELAREQEKKDAWTITLDEQFIPVVGDNFFVPIVEREVSVSSKNLGRVTFDNDQMRTVSMTPIYLAQPKTGKTFTRRPTLFVTIHGANGFLDWEPDPVYDPPKIICDDPNDKPVNPDPKEFFSKEGCEEELRDLNNTEGTWQTILDTRIRHYALASDSQYAHFIVEWQSDESNRNQVKDLARTINDFLEDKKYKWDVVITGFSRGGIFAHDVSKRLADNDKVQNLQTVLLDPTAASPFNDIYPSSGVSVKNGKHIGYVYYDNKDFLSDLDTLNLRTISDKKIPGYTNNGRNDFYKSVSDHEAIRDKWVDPIQSILDFSTVWNDLLNLKTASGYSADGNSGTVVVTIKQSSVYVDLDFSVESGQVTVSGELNLGKAGTAGIHYQGSLDSFEVQSNTVLNSAYLSIDKDRAEVAASIGVTDINSSLSSSGFEHSYETLGIFETNTEVSLTGFKGDVRIFGKTVSVNFDKKDYVVSVGKEVVRAGENLIKIAKKVTIFGSIFGW